METDRRGLMLAALVAPAMVGLAASVTAAEFTKWRQDTERRARGDASLGCCVGKPHFERDGAWRVRCNARRRLDEGSRRYDRGLCSRRKRRFGCRGDAERRSRFLAHKACPEGDLEADPLPRQHELSR